MPLWRQGKFAETLPLMEEALPLAKKGFGPESSFAATTLLNLGVIHARMGRYAKAETFLLRALAIEETLQEKNAAFHPSLPCWIGP